MRKASAIPADRAIVTTRLIDAPRELVWKAWTDPAHLTHWWGPRGFSTTTSEFDMREGGVWRFVMHGPDGTDYKNKIVYKDVREFERLAYRHTGEDETAGIVFDSEVTFTAKDGKTEVTLCAVFATAEERNFVAEKFGAVEGGEQTLTRLGEYVLGMAGDGTRPTGQPFVITRVLAAPRELIWDAWTKAEHLMHWWGPKGCKVEIKALDVRPGGRFHYVMRYSTGAAMWGRFTYDEIAPPARLVYRSSFSNEAGEIAPAPFPGDWPDEISNTVTFEERAGKTTVTIVAAPHAASEAQRTYFEGMFGSLEGGYSGMIEVLEGYLKSITA